MKHQSADPAAHPDAPHTAASQAPLQALRWAVLRRVRTHQRIDRVDNHIDETCDMEPQIVGVRDQASGKTRIFTVYSAPTSVTQGAEPPPDPDPPPAAPAQARQPAEWSDSDEATPGAWPHARAA